jgi:quercetin dioxygenase-like cupin family protein
MLTALLLFVGLPLMTTANPNVPTIVLPDQVQWSAGTGSLAGAEVAVLAGDPAKPGPFVMRIRVPDGTKFGPHFHGDAEGVTVISGMMLVGVGDKATESEMTALPAGSYASIPAGVHHYAMAKGLTVIQLGGNGPFTMTAVGQGK